MPYRQEKLNSIFSTLLPQLIAEEIEFPANLLVTISRVDVAPNLRSAKVWVSCWPFEKSALAIETLQAKHQFLIEHLNRKIKLRKIPLLLFRIDDSEELAEKIEKTVDTLKLSQERE